MQIMAIGLLRAHFREVGFDASLKQLLATRHPNSTDLRTQLNTDSIVSAMSKYGVQVTSDEVQGNLLGLLPPDNATLMADYTRLQTGGLDLASRT
jgi:uroporphyrinogen-III synthase